MQNDDYLRQLEDIRARNNALWLELLRIAIEEAPVRTKKVIQVINDNDRAISALLEKLAK